MRISVLEKQTGLSASDLPAPGVCGTSLDDRITNGEETAITEFPWMVLLEYTKRNTLRHVIFYEIFYVHFLLFSIFVAKGQKGFQCGGVLINKDYVLTGRYGRTDFVNAND